ncbi:kelch repeat protein, partial [Ostertagia ostertagi]
QESCSVFLKNELDLTNCLAVRSLAEKYECHDLLSFAEQFILHNFQEVVGLEEFYLLSVDQLVKFISSEELQVRSEEQLLEHVRLPLCSPKFLVGTVGEDPLLSDDTACQELVNEAKLATLEHSKLQGPRIRPRKVLSGEVLYAVGGWSRGQGYSSVERLDPGEADPVWQTGWRCSCCSRQYDPSTNRWLCNLAPTSSPRDSFGLVALDGSLYAVGGRFHDTSLNVVERYDVRRNEWIYVAPMGTRRHGVTVSVLNGCIYAVGGADTNTVLNTVERRCAVSLTKDMRKSVDLFRLDPRVGNWESVPPMSTYRHHLGSAVLDGYLYVVGGHDGSSVLNSVERYNPITNEWNEVAAMNWKRHVGGEDTADLNSVEVFAQETNQWVQHSSMKE